LRLFFEDPKKNQQVFSIPARLPDMNPLLDPHSLTINASNRQRKINKKKNIPVTEERCSGMLKTIFASYLK
jgi:hypothetical protein